MATQTITADSKPVYCYFGGADCWTCNDLIQWHQQMVAVYGVAEANKRFIDSWTNDTPFICEQADCRTLNSNFRDYFKQVGILSDLFSGIGVIAQPIGVANDVIGNASDVLSNIAGATVNTTKTLKYVLPALIVIAAIIGIVYATKQLKIA